jgi:hypothetical protein
VYRFHAARQEFFAGRKKPRARLIFPDALRRLRLMPKIHVANVRDGFIAADPKDKALFETVPQALNFSEKVQDP